MKQALGFPCYLSQLHAATLTEVAPTSSSNTLPMNAIILVLRKHLVNSPTQPITDPKMYTVVVGAIQASGFLNLISQEV
jgi:hypothetical protein